MKNKKISATERDFLKNQYGIAISSNQNRTCNNCFNYSNQKVCAKHFIVTKGNEYCEKFSSRRIVVFGGGSASSK